MGYFFLEAEEFRRPKDDRAFLRRAKFCNANTCIRHTSTAKVANKRPLVDVDDNVILRNSWPEGA